MQPAEKSPTKGNPFPGLRPFREEEEHLFFGRERQVDSLVDKLAGERFMAVVGSSGSGKSSLVNCGLRPALRRGLMATAGTSWRIAQSRPGGNPVRAMSQALATEARLFDEVASDVMSLDDIIEGTLLMSKRGLIDIYRQALLDERTNLLIVVDQFEELFRYSSLDGSRHARQTVAEPAIHFVNLLLEAKAHSICPIFVVVTMRSDFLGDCAHFPGLPEAINAGLYMVPRMSRDERREAVRGPVKVFGGEIAPILLNRLVNDVGDDPDQLSILQHALNRTWARWQQDGEDRGPLDLRHYEDVGTMRRALDRHAEKAYSEITSNRGRELCRKMFQALTDHGTDPRGVRRPLRLSKLCEITGASAEELTEVIDRFRKPSRSFLMPPITESLSEATVIDISHETLMRVWTRLRRWSAEEARSARVYRRLADTAVLHAEGKAGLWRDPDLQLALDWQARESPNAAWASLYPGNFEAATSFLAKSKESRDADEDEAEFENRWQRARNVFALGFAIMFLFNLLGLQGHLTIRSQKLTELLPNDVRQELTSPTEASLNDLKSYIDTEREHLSEPAVLTLERIEGETDAIKPPRREQILRLAVENALVARPIERQPALVRMALDAAGRPEIVPQSWIHLSATLDEAFRLGAHLFGYLVFVFGARVGLRQVWFPATGSSRPMRDSRVGRIASRIGRLLKALWVGLRAPATVRVASAGVGSGAVAVGAYGVAMGTVSGQLVFMIAVAVAVAVVLVVPPDAWLKGRLARIVRVAQGIAIFAAGVGVLMVSVVAILAGIAAFAATVGSGLALCFVGRRRLDEAGSVRLAATPELRPVVYVRPQVRAGLTRRSTLTQWLRSRFRPRDQRILARTFNPLGPFMLAEKDRDRLLQWAAAKKESSETSPPTMNDVLGQSELVIVQLDGELTETASWELRQTLRAVPPERLLVYFSRNLAAERLGEAYGTVAEAARGVLPKPLPRSIDPDHFVRFKADGQAKSFGAVTGSRFSWGDLIPVLGALIDGLLLRRSMRQWLAPFFEELEVPSRNIRLFGDRAIGWAACVPGGLASGYMIFVNLRRLHCRKAVLFGLLPLAATLVMPFFLMPFILILSFLFMPFFFVASLVLVPVATYSLWKRLSGPAVRRHMAFGGAREPGWKGAAVVAAAVALYALTTVLAPVVVRLGSW